MRRTPQPLEERVINGILGGLSYKKISALTGVPVSTIKNIKSRYKEKIESKNQSLIEDHYINSKKVLAESYAELSRILDKSKEGIIELSVNELLSICKEMHVQGTTSSPQGSFGHNLQSLAQKYH